MGFWLYCSCSYLNWIQSLKVKSYILIAKLGWMWSCKTWCDTRTEEELATVLQMFRSSNKSYNFFACQSPVVSLNFNFTVWAVILTQYSASKLTGDQLMKGQRTETTDLWLAIWIQPSLKSSRLWSPPSCSSRLCERKVVEVREVTQQKLLNASESETWLFYEPDFSSERENSVN